MASDPKGKLRHMLQSAEDWNYVPVGNMLFITEDFQVIDDEDVTAQQLAVVTEFVIDLTVRKDFVSFVDAHVLDTNNGYYRGICATPGP